MPLRYYQRETLVKNILAYVAEANAASLLDIGAGSVATALSISRSVGRYLAVEVDEKRANALREAGLRVVAERFPAALTERFDLVLSSHSIPELSEASLDDYAPFLEAAWGCVAAGGFLLVVTFKGSGGDLAALAAELAARFGLPPRDNESREFAAVADRLATFGKLLVERVNSYAVAGTAEEIAAFLTPWLIGSKRSLAPAADDFLRRIIEKRYCVRPDLYLFPTEHLFMSCRRA